VKVAIAVISRSQEAEARSQKGKDEVDGVVDRVVLIPEGLQRLAGG